ELRRLQIVEAANGLTTAAGQPRIRRRRDAERVEVRRRREHVVGDDEVAERRPEVRDLDADAGHQLVSDANGALPVVWAVTEAMRDVVVVRRARDGRA